MTFVCYPKCTTCQKAQKWLNENHIAYELRDIKTENPAYEELAAWHRRSGLPLKNEKGSRGDTAGPFFGISALICEEISRCCCR